MRQRSGVTTVGIIGGLLVLLMVAAAGCDTTEPETTGGSTVPSPRSTTTATQMPTTPTLTPTNTPVVTPCHTPTSEPTPSPAATQTSVPTATHVPTVRPTQTATATPQPTSTPSPSPTATPTPTAREVAAAHLVEAIPWFENPPGAAYADIAEVLIDLWLRDTDLGNAVAGLPWVADRVSEEEAGVLHSLRYIADADQGLAKQVVSYPWFGDDVTDVELKAVGSLGSIASQDLDLARLAASLPWFADDVTDVELKALDALGNLASTDLELARLVASLPWFADDVTDIELDAVGALGNLASTDLELARLAASLPWFADHVTDVELKALDALGNLASTDLELARLVASLPWFADDVTDIELDALHDLGSIASQDLDLARLVASLPWFADDVTDVEPKAVYALGSIASQDLDLARLVASLPWFADDVADIELDALHDLGSIASQDLDLARLTASLPWFADDVTNAERVALHDLGSIASQDLDLARLVASLPWFADDVTDIELDAVGALGNLASQDLDLARLVASLPWFADDVTDIELDAVGALGNLASQDLDLARLVASLPWFADDVTDIEPDAVYALGNLASQDLDLARLVASLPWFADDVTDIELHAIHHLLDVAFYNLDLARMVASLPWFADGREGNLKFYVLRSLAGLVRLGADVLGQLTAQPWFADGLDDDEAAFVVTLRNVAFKDPELYDDMLRTRYTRHKTASLPLAGDVNIWVIESAPPPPDEDLLTIIEDTARITEGFLGVPFPMTDIVLLIVPGEGQLTGGHHGSHMVLPRWDDVKSVLHETAHYYFRGGIGPRWLFEGGAQFVEAYVNDRRGVQDLADRIVEVSRQNPCGHIENIRHNTYSLETRGPLPIVGEERCAYYLGENFLLNLFATIGEEATASALRDLYLLQLGSEYGIDGVEEEVYRTLLKHTPVDRQEAFRDLYRRLHGGAHAFPETDFSDEHGDKASAASAIAVGEVVRGTLDYMFDFDYFRFKAEEGMKYRMNVEHESLPISSVILYASDGLTKQKDWKSHRRVSSGPQILWVVPRSGEYYFAVQNFGGKTGPYTLTITAVEDATDDHGDTVATATRLLLREVVGGVVDDDFDFDYFRFGAVEGQRYRMDVTRGTLEYFRIRLYTPDGAEPANWYGNHYFDDSSSAESRDWVAPSSGQYYLAIDGAFGRVGTYTLTITQNNEPACMPNSGQLTLEQEQQISDLPWAQGNPWSVRALERLAIGSPVAFQAWMQRFGDDKTSAPLIETYASIAFCDEAAALQILRMPFLDDAAIRETRDSLVLEGLSRLAKSNLADLEEVISHPQLQGGITDESAALFLLLLLDREDPAAAAAIRALPWIEDGITYTDHAVSRAVNIIVEDETSHVVYLVHTAKRANKSFWAFVELPWVRDGYNTSELSIIRDIYFMSRWDDEATARVLEMPFLETLGFEESRIMSLLLDTARRRGLQQLIASPHFEDGIRDGQSVTVALVDLELQHPDASAAANGLESLFRSLLTKTWVQDSLSLDELIVIHILTFMASTPVAGTNGRIDEATPLRILEMPFLQEEITSLDVKALSSLQTLFFRDQDSLQKLLSHPEIRGFITDDRTNLVAVAGLVAYRPDLLDALLDPERTSVEMRVITLPHAGEVKLSIIEPDFKETVSSSHSDSAALDPMDLLEHAVRTYEDFMDVAFPEGDVVLFVSPQYSGGYAGHGLITSDSRSSAYVIAHETAHIWEVEPYWIVEGVAEFLAAISERARVGTPLPQPESTCSLANNIADLIEMGGNVRVIYNSACYYILGQGLFLELYYSLGHEAFRQGFRNVHLMSIVNVLAEDRKEECADNDAGLCYFRTAFLSDLTPEQKAIANEIITRRYHGTSP